MNSHSGTHIDLPRHFCKNRESVRDLLMAENLFFPTYSIPCKKEAGEMITTEDIEPALDRVSDAEALLIRTGFSSRRRVNPLIYTSSHPGIDPEIADLLSERCKNLKLIGIDVISVSLPGKRDLGQRCHKAFLCRNSPILILEDAFIPECRNIYFPATLSIYPFLVDNLDGVPVIAIFEHQTL